MASILGRFTDIMKSNINELLDKMEDPEKMIDQMLRNCEDNLGKVKSETAGVMAVEKEAKRKLDECNAEIDRMTKLVEKALKAGNEGDAMQFVQRKLEKENLKQSLESTYADAHKNAENMRAMHDKLVKDIDSLRARRDTVKAKMQVAKTQETINKMTGATISSANSSLDAFKRMEDKANKRLDKATAEAELAQSSNSLDSLEEKYGYGGDSDAEAELARIKASMGL